ncbi:MAG: hypothetical protein H6642_07120 [Caldilineaceae bacterium]|nr:hypothetical protein [Caldilineaceae bacterium]
MSIQAYNSISYSISLPSIFKLGPYRYPTPTARIGSTTSGEEKSEPQPAIRLNLRVTDDQAWYFSEEWQAEEAEADQNLIDGEYEDFDNMEDLLKSL